MRIERCYYQLVKQKESEKKSEFSQFSEFYIQKRIKNVWTVHAKSGNKRNNNTDFYWCFQKLEG